MMIWLIDNLMHKGHKKEHESSILRNKKEVKEILEYSLIAVVMVLIGLGVGYFLRKNIAEGKLNQAEQEAARIIANGERTAESKKKEALLEAKEEIHKLRSDVERENKDRRSELQRMERRILQKEESLDKKLDNIEHKEEALHRKEADLAQSREKVEALYEKQMAELERISGMTFEEAKNILLTNVEQEIRHETAIMVKEMEQQAQLQPFFIRPKLRHRSQYRRQVRRHRTERHLYRCNRQHPKIRQYRQTICFPNRRIRQIPSLRQRTAGICQLHLFTGKQQLLQPMESPYL